MGIEAQLPAILTVVATATIDSINPCAIGVLILMISVVLAAKQKTKRLVFLGSVYIGAVFFAYLAAGLGLVYFINAIPLVVAQYLSIGVATLLIVAGIIEIKDYFWYGRWFSLAIPPVLADKLHAYASRTTTWGIAFLGFFVAAVELPCTGAPYLAIITILSQVFDMTAFLLLILYNIIFVLPLIIILLLVAGGRRVADIQHWKTENRPSMRLLTGILMVVLSWILILMANGTINFG